MSVFLLSIYNMVFILCYFSQLKQNTYSVRLKCNFYLSRLMSCQFCTSCIRLGYSCK